MFTQWGVVIQGDSKEKQHSLGNGFIESKEEKKKQHVTHKSENASFPRKRVLMVQLENYIFI